MVGDKAHRLEMRVSHVCDWNTSRQSFDGSGEVLRGMKGDLDSNSIFIDFAVTIVATNIIQVQNMSIEIFLSIKK